MYLMNRGIAFLFGLFLVASLLPGADFWRTKTSADWTGKEAKRMITTSPWARQVTLQKEMRGPSGGPRGRGMPGRGGAMGTSAEEGSVSDGMGGGGRGGRGGGGGGAGGSMGGSMPMPTVVVVWDSSLPVQEARAKLETPGPAKDRLASFYIVFVVGFPPMRPQADPSGMRNRLLQTAALVRKGKDPLRAADVEVIPNEKTLTLRFFFPRSQAVQAEDRDVTFRLRMGPMEVQAKFSLKEMVFQGSLAL